MNDRDIDVERFRREGYLLLRNLFTPLECAEMRARVLESIRRVEFKEAPVTDALADHLMHPFVHDQRVLAAARTLLGREDVTYFGDGSFAVLGPQL